jgi:hypothetical protein
VSGREGEEERSVSELQKKEKKRGGGGEEALTALRKNIYIYIYDERVWRLPDGTWPNCISQGGYLARQDPHVLFLTLLHIFIYKLNIICFYI